MAFCSVIETRLLGDAPEGGADGEVPEVAEAPAQQPARTRGGESYVLVDMLSAREPLQIIVSPAETVAELKQKIEFQESIMSSLQILVFKGKRLADRDTLRSSNVRSGATLKLIVAQRTIGSGM